MIRILQIFKSNALTLSMMVGVAAYLLYHFTPALAPAGPFCRTFCEKGQPVFIFLMLYCQFNKVAPSQLRFRRWHLDLLLIQAGIFVLSALCALALDKESLPRILVESFMVCMICPTATASGVITDKLGGDLPGVITYIVLINLMYCILFPLMVPVIRPVEGLSFGVCFLRIVKRVFPTLVMPCLAAWLVRWLFPSFQRWVAQFKDLAFYLWVVSLSICLVLTTRIIVLCHIALFVLLLIGMVSFVSCMLQFALGHAVGRKSGPVEDITAGQSLGQKNTALMIWASYNFLSPQTAVAGGFYSIWHNIVNQRELKKKSRSSE